MWSQYAYECVVVTSTPRYTSSVMGSGQVGSVVGASRWWGNTEGERGLAVVGWMVGRSRDVFDKPIWAIVDSRGKRWSLVQQWPWRLDWEKVS